jgi:hypothetical protein
VSAVQLHSGPPPTTLRKLQEICLMQVAMTQDETMILALFNGEIWIYNTTTCSYVRHFKAKGERLSCFSFDEWKLVAVGSSVFVWDIRDEFLIRSMDCGVPFVQVYENIEVYC